MGMGMGQAAGTAAAMAVITGRSPRDVEVSALQTRIVAAGGILEMPHSDEIEVGGKAAVDGQHLAGDVGSILKDKEAHEGGDFTGMAEAPDLRLGASSTPFQGYPKRMSAWPTCRLRSAPALTGH